MTADQADDQSLAPTRNGGSRPVPDPTELTDRAIARLEKTMTAYIDSQLAIRDERLRGIDIATQLNFDALAAARQAIVDKVLSDEVLQVERFALRDVRAERESQLNKIALDAAFNASKEAVAAALTAQKEAASRQDEANQKAIDKSELATAEKINKLEQLVTVKTDALSDKIDDVKETANSSVQQKVGATEQRSEHTDSRVAVYTTIGLIVSLAVAGIAIIGLLLKLSGSGV